VFSPHPIRLPTIPPAIAPVHAVSGTAVRIPPIRFSIVVAVVVIVPPRIAIPAVAVEPPVIVMPESVMAEATDPGMAESSVTGSIVGAAATNAEEIGIPGTERTQSVVPDVVGMSGLDGCTFRRDEEQCEQGSAKDENCCFHRSKPLLTR
jgi:hypothetical protein